MTALPAKELTSLSAMLGIHSMPKELVPCRGTRHLSYLAPATAYAIGNPLVRIPSCRMDCVRTHSMGLGHMTAKYCRHVLRPSLTPTLCLSL